DVSSDGAGNAADIVKSKIVCDHGTPTVGAKLDGGGRWSLVVGRWRCGVSHRDLSITLSSYRTGWPRTSDQLPAFLTPASSVSAHPGTSLLCRRPAHFRG